MNSTLFDQFQSILQPAFQSGEPKPSIRCSYAIDTRLDVRTGNRSIRKHRKRFPPAESPHRDARTLHLFGTLIRRKTDSVQKVSAIRRRFLFLCVVSPRVRPASKYSRGRIGLLAGDFR